MNTADQLKAIISDLVNDGLEILKNSDSVNATDSGSMSELARKYIVWYTKARRLLGNTSPSDLKHFDELYRLEDEKNPSTISHFFSYPKDQHWDNSSQQSYYSKNESHFRHFKNNFSAQIAIIEAVPQALEFEKIKLTQLLARDLLADELNQARELLDRGFIECAGMLAGIALERQLKVICDHSIPPIAYSDKDTLGDLNSKLRTMYSDPSDYSRVDAIRITRNRCSHDPGTKQPTRKDVEVMVSDVENFIKSH